MKTITAKAYDSNVAGWRLGFTPDIGKRLKKHKMVYIMALPVVLYYLIFHYGPIYGALIAFKDFDISKGIMGSPWVGMKHFISFFTGPYFIRTLTNTLLISFYEILFGFPAPIILALLLNELYSDKFKRTVQTITYLPHFISTVVICGMIHTFVGREGIITDLYTLFGGTRGNLLVRPELFRTIFVSSGIWQGFGWGSIVYLSALSAIDTQQYEAAELDGAGRFRKMWHITLPALAPTIIILLILKIGSVMTVGFEKIILLYNPNTYETADVISSFVYRKGLGESFQYSFSTAVGLFTSVVNFLLVVTCNFISRKITNSSLW
jgi:putative aldouronate transport system permease protein